jgi:hypothetical protein
MIGVTAGPSAAATADCGGTADAADVGIDVNGDGCVDAVVGMPDRTVGGKRGAGAIEIDLGSPTRHLRARSILVTAEHPHTGDRFGAAFGFTSGTPTGIVIGAPGRNVASVRDSGAIVVLPGSPTWPAVVRIPNRSFNVITSRPHRDARVGTAVEVADTPTRNADGSFSFPTTIYAGAPGWNVDGQRGAGAVVAARLDLLTQGGSGSRRIISENAPGVPGRSRAGDRFGSAIAFSLYFAGGEDGSFIAIGAPGKSVDRKAAAGAVVITVTPTSHVTASFISQDSPGDPNAPELGDHFGAVLKTEDVALYIGVPDEDVGDRADAGIVEDYDPSGGYRFTLQQGKRHFPGRPEAGDHFGAALSFLASSRTTDLCAPSLIVGVPGQDVAGLPDAGEVDCGGRAPLRMGARLPGSLQAHARVGAALQTMQSGRWLFQDPNECDCPPAQPYFLTLVGAPGVRGGDGAVFAGARRHAPIWRRSDDPSNSHYGMRL